MAGEWKPTLAALALHEDPSVGAPVTLVPFHAGQALALARLLVAHGTRRKLGRTVAR